MVKHWFKVLVKHWLVSVCFYMRVISCRIKPKNFFFLVLVGEFQLYFTAFLKIYVTVTYFVEEIFNIKNWKQKTFDMVFFLQFYEPPDLGKKIFTSLDVLKSEVYLTWINFWKFHDNLKACLDVIDSQADPKCEI